MLAALRAGVQGVGIAGQMHGATLLGPDDRPLRPAILWNDGRSHAQCDALERAVPQSRAITGNIAMPGFTAPKLLWVRAHEPALFDQVATVLLPKDYVRLAMSGDKASDRSDSAGTLWLDCARRDWSDEMLAACGLDRGAMPALFDGNGITGQLRATVAADWGMACVPIAAGGGDNAAGAAGVGVVDDGDALLSLGTSGVIFVATRQFRTNTDGAVHSFCHCLPDMWHQMAVHLSAAACVDWAARLTGMAGPAALFEAAQYGAETGGGAGGDVLFFPYLSGERTPHNNPHVRGAFTGLDHDSSPHHIAQAVLEGVAFAFADGLAALNAAGTGVSQLAVIGGGARSTYWGRVIASALNIPLVYLDGGDVGPALGAAKLAQHAITGGPASTIFAKPPIIRTVEP
ncbi:MAG: xylulokinase, partial [Sphingopyxis sp.]